MSFENQPLFQKKISIIESIPLPQITLRKHKFIYNYHGIKLSFNSKNQTFLEKLKSFLPVSWLCEIHSYELHFLDSKDFGIEGRDWCDESSQDCIEHTENIGIQRDFVAKEFKNKTVVIISDLRVEDGFFNFLRWFLSRKLIDIGTLILHSSCLLDKQGRAHFFLGHSGAGKTTLTKVSKPRLILGDDMNLLSIKNEEIYAQAGAIGGKFLSDIPYSDKVEIGSFNWLIQDSEIKRVKLNQGEARIKLIASVSNIFWETLSKDKTETIMKIVEKAILKAPMYKLHFKKSDSFWSLIES